jgi:hypothetical protein
MASMRALVSNLACLMLAAHLMLGCCWHHAHACETACHLDGHSGEADHDHDRHAPPAEGDDHCQGERCSFLVVAKVRLDSGSGAASPVGLLAETSSQAYADLAWLHLSVDRTDSGPPLRLHLLHRVLRI